MVNSITDIFLHCMIVEINIIFSKIDISLALFLSNLCLTEMAMGRNNYIWGVYGRNYHISTGVYFVLLIRNCHSSEPV